MFTMINFRKSSEGRVASGPLVIAAMFRVICTGVRINPHGNPHQPATSENAALPAWLLVAQERQLTCCFVDQRVNTSADHT